MKPRVVAAIAFSAIGWGLGAVGVRVAFDAGVSTFTVIDVRLTVAGATVAVYVLAKRRRVSPLAWRHGAIIGIPRIGLAPVVFIASLNHISAGVEGLFITLIPVVTSAMAWLLIREPIRRVQILGLVIGLAGVLLIIVAGESGLGDGEGDIAVGATLALLGVLAGSLSGALSRKYAPFHDTADLALPMFATGTLIALTASLVFAPPVLGELDLGLWTLLFALAFGSTLLPFVGTLYAARYTTAIRVAVVGYLAPILAVVGGVVLLDEVLTPGIVVGGALAITGAVLVGVDRTKRSPVTSAAGTTA